MNRSPRGRRFGFGLIVVSTLVLAAGYASAALPSAALPSAALPSGAPAFAPWTFVLGIPCLIVGLMALGTARADRRLGRLIVPFVFVWLVLVVGFGAVLLLPPADPLDPTLWLGLPPRAAVVLYGVGALPVLVLPLAYALSFDALTLSETDLERVRAARRRSDGPA